MITPDILEEFKERMHITHYSEDSNISRLLSFSCAYLKQVCGEFDLTNERAKELVFERTRFAYNDALEYFDDSFSSQIHSLGMEIALKEGEYDAPTL